MEKAKQNLKVKDGRLLKYLTALAEEHSSKRIQTTALLLKFLNNQQTRSDQETCDDVQYTLKRLLRGLASDRKFARLGYSLALCQILRNVEGVDGKLVLDCIEKTLTAEQTNKSGRNVLLGKAFAYLALVHAGVLPSLEGNQVGQVVKRLLKICSEKQYLEQLCMQGIIQAIQQVDAVVYKKWILPHIERQFTAGWGNCTPNTLLLLLFSNKHHQECVQQFLTDHWLDQQLVSEKNFTFIADVVVRSTECFPVIHPLIDELISHTVAEKLNVVKFWKIVVCPLFDGKASATAVRTLALYILEKLIPHLDSSKKITSLLTPHAADILVHYNPTKTDDAAKWAKQLMGSLTSLVTGSSDGQVQLAVVKSLVRSPGSFMFDRLTKTSTLSNMIAHFVPDAASSMLQELMKAFTCQSSWVSDGSSSSRVECGQWCLKEITTLVNPGNPSAWQLSGLQFLFIHAFCTVDEACEDIPHCVPMSKELPEALRKCAVATFFKTISKFITFRGQGVSRATQTNQVIQVLYQLVGYIQTLLEDKHVRLVNEQFTDEAREDWDTLLPVLAKVDKKRQVDTGITDKHAFELLFLHHGFQLFEEPDGTARDLQDLYVCYEKATQVTKRRKSMKVDDGPAWIDVMTELLLSMVFQGSKLSKNVAKAVMAGLADHMTPDALNLLLDALKQTSLDNAITEEGQVGMEEEDDKDDSDDEDDKTQDDDDKAGSDEDDDDDENDDDADSSEASDVEEEGGISVGDAVKQKIKAALGDTAADSDEDADDDDDDLSDSEMFKRDKVLAAAFSTLTKCQKKVEKEKAKQLLQYKLGVLDLLEVILKHHPSFTIIKAVVIPLIELVDSSGKRKKVDETLRERGLEILRDVVKGKKTTADPTLDRDDILEMVNTLMACSRKVEAGMVPEVAKVCALMIRLLLNIQLDTRGPSPLHTRRRSAIIQKPETVIKDHDYYQEKVVNIIQDGLLAMINHKPDRCPRAFFHVIIDRYPTLLWSVSSDLLRIIESSNTKVYPKTVALSMLASLIHKHVDIEVGDEHWNEFLQDLAGVSKKVIGAMSAADVKVMFIEELLTVYGKLQHVSAECCSMVLGEAEMTTLESIMPSCNQQSRHLFNKLRPHNDSNSKKKKKKKRKTEEKETEINETPVKKKKKDAIEPDSGDTGAGSNDVKLGSIDEADEPKTPARKKGRKSVIGADTENKQKQETGSKKSGGPVNGCDESTFDPSASKRKSGKLEDFSVEQPVALEEEETSSKLKKSRKSNASESVGKIKMDKFSPRHTRSMKK